MLTRRLTILVISMLICGYGETFAAPAPLPPVAGVRIELLTHDARKPLRAGERVTVTLRGSTGGSATFHIFGVVANVGMREIRTGVYQAQPALYTGTYVVRPGDLARNAAVLATLTVGQQGVTAAANRSITIDTRGPVITSRQPKPGATLTNGRPNIVVNFLDPVSAVNPGAVRMVVNGQNVTARTSISETSAAFNPEGPFPPGPVRVQLTASDRSGNAERAEWSFTIAPTDGLIKSVTINPATPLTRGDILTVVMTGTPAGRASFTIQGLQGVVPMRESRTAGVYFGTLQIEAGQSLTEAPLLVTLEKDGQRGAAAAAAGVTIVGPPPPAPSIVAPGQAVVLGEEVVTRMILRGRARPGLRVLVRVSYVARGASADEGGALGEFVTVTGTDGNWSVAIGPVIAPEGSKVVATVIAIDQAGQRSPAASREVAEVSQ
jgi:hypothetical protein